jgi:HTH-type transcriptional regulator, sugar sensing transcriptional regulator
MDIEIPLKEYGLSEKEIKVYLALLPLGTVNLQQIAKRLDFPRTTVYNTLNQLTEKGLVSRIEKKGVNHFTAAEPEKLSAKLEERKKLIESIIPNLNHLKSQVTNLSSVEIYEGFKGVYTVLTDVFKKKQQTYYFGGYAGALEILKHIPDHARMMRLKKKIPAKIVIAEMDAEIFHKKAYKELTEMRFLDSMRNFPCMVLMYGDNVAIHTVEGELIGIIIRNKEVSAAMRMVFDMYWKQAKPAKI